MPLRKPRPQTVTDTMGLFKHKEKNRPTGDTLNLQAAQTQAGTGPVSPTTISRPQQNSGNSYHDSTYYSSSNVSNTDTEREKAQVNQAPPQHRGAAPGTTVTTTTTTTTTTTVVSSDGTTYTQSHPYNPSSDPPPQSSETTVNQSVPSASNTSTSISQNSVSPQNQNQAYEQSPADSRNSNPIIQTQAPTPQASQSSKDNAGIKAPGRKLTPTQTVAGFSAPGASSEEAGRTSPHPGTKLEPPLPTIPMTPSLVTNGGRPIPTRNESQHASVSPHYRKNSQGESLYELGTGPSHEDVGNTGFGTISVGDGGYDEWGQPTPPMPKRSERRNSREGGGVVQPLRRRSGDVGGATRSEQEQGVVGDVSPVTPVDGSVPQRVKTPNFSRPAVGSPGNASQPPIPNTADDLVGSTLSSGGIGSINHIASPPSAVSPDQQQSQSHLPIVSQTHSTPPKKKSSLMGALRGLHGAGDAIRGSVNEKIAHGMHDTNEEERQRAIREKGMGDWRTSGLSERVPAGVREGFREQADKRIRNRRASREYTGIHGSEGPGGLEAVEERSINSVGR